MKTNKIQLLILIACFGGFISCKSTKSASSNMLISDTMLVYKEEIIITEETFIDKEVTIYPEAFLKTNGNGKIIFSKKVNILGETQVFDDSVNIVFNRGTISSLNPCWFGAKGYDEIDDTKAFIKTLQVARNYSSSINVKIPIGKFRISETLEIGNDMANGKSINIIGESMSSNSKDGSCLEWHGFPETSLILLKNYCVGNIENLDFTAPSSNLLKHNIEMRPTDYQIGFINCSFTGCGGTGSANVNLNSGNNLQVSEIYFQNCIFRGNTNDTGQYVTESAVMGGWANTKNFSFQLCSFLGYNKGAIVIETSDILRVEGCTFANNELDISCMVCGTIANGNYSEFSKSFFKSTISDNISFTTLINNCIYGRPSSDYIIKDGGGNLVLLNNDFGGFGGEDLANTIKWDQRVLSHIYSFGNFFRNATDQTTPFYNRLDEERVNRINSNGDLIGIDGINIKEVTIKKSDQDIKKH